MKRTRSGIVKKIMTEDVGQEDIVVASTGFISREVYKYDRSLNFYISGAMGSALSVGVGIAWNVKSKVIVINGDGSALMALGSLITARSLFLPNLEHHIIDNNCHESTGGQPTNSFSVLFNEIGGVNTFRYICGKDETVPPRIDIPMKKMTERFRNAVKPYCHQ